MKLGNECYGLNAPKSHVLKLSPHCGSVTYKGKTIMNWASERLTFCFLALLSCEDMVYSSTNCYIAAISTLKEK